jgi:hypothetical protein
MDELTVLQRRNFTKRAGLTQKRQLDKIVQVLMLEVLGLLIFFEVSRFLVFGRWNLPRWWRPIRSTRSPSGESSGCYRGVAQL